MIFVFAGLGLILVGTILVGSLVFDVGPQRRDDPSSNAPVPTVLTESEAP